MATWEESFCPLCVGGRSPHQHGYSSGHIVSPPIKMTADDVFAAGWALAINWDHQPFAAEPQPSLEDAVAAQIAALTQEFAGTGGAEPGKAPPDLTAYDAALASAVSHCLHEAAWNETVGRWWFCPTCNRRLDKAAMRAALQDRGFDENDIEIVLS